MVDMIVTLADLVHDHDQRWDHMTDMGMDRLRRHDPEAAYHWHAAAACEELLFRLRDQGPDVAAA